MSPRLRSALTLIAIVLVVSGAAQAWRAWSGDRVGAEIAARAAPGDILMIASDTCPFCVKTRAFFEQHGVAFSECSIERDEACAARFRAHMSPGTPLLLVRGRAQVGFDPQRVAKALGAS
ncbi:MAG: glutaredoxin family protein [Burkholderiaceae bacterium]|nr:glutaredoxin family protein [Burkholderiaceae bacterium]